MKTVPAEDGQESRKAALKRPVMEGVDADVKAHVGGARIIHSVAEFRAYYPAPDPPLRYFDERA